jgi:hypothetical protein
MGKGVKPTLGAPSRIPSPMTLPPEHFNILRTLRSVPSLSTRFTEKQPDCSPRLGIAHSARRARPLCDPARTFESPTAPHVTTTWPRGRRFRSCPGARASFPRWACHVTQPCARPIGATAEPRPAPSQARFEQLRWAMTRVRGCSRGSIRAARRVRVKLGRRTRATRRARRARAERRSPAEAAPLLR